MKKKKSKSRFQRDLSKSKIKWRVHFILVHLLSPSFSKMMAFHLSLPLMFAFNLNYLANELECEIQKKKDGMQRAYASSVSSSSWTGNSKAWNCSCAKDNYSALPDWSNRTAWIMHPEASWNPLKIKQLLIIEGTMLQDDENQKRNVHELLKPCI